MFPPTIAAHPLPQSEDEGPGENGIDQPEGRSISNWVTGPPEKLAVNENAVVEPGRACTGDRQAVPAGVLVAVAEEVAVAVPEEVVVFVEVAVPETVDVPDTVAVPVGVPEFVNVPLFVRV